MKFNGICIITGNVPRLARFYEQILKTASEGDDIHTAIPMDGAALVIYSKAAAENDMKFDFGRYWGSGNFTISFTVDDVDLEYERLKALNVEFVTSPKTYPWGARSVHFRDPDGNIVTFACRPEGL